MGGGQLASELPAVRRRLLVVHSPPPLPAVRQPVLRELLGQAGASRRKAPAQSQLKDALSLSLRRSLPPPNHPFCARAPLGRRHQQISGRSARARGRSDRDGSIRGGGRDRLPIAIDPRVRAVREAAAQALHWRGLRRGPGRRRVLRTRARVRAALGRARGDERATGALCARSLAARPRARPERARAAAAAADAAAALQPALVAPSDPASSPPLDLPAAATSGVEGAHRVRFLERVLTRTRGVAAAAAATPAAGNVSFAVGTVTNAVGTLVQPVRGATIARLLQGGALGSHAAAALLAGSSAGGVAGHDAGRAGSGAGGAPGGSARSELLSASQLDTLTHALVLVSTLSLTHAESAARLGIGRALAEVIREMHAEVSLCAEARGEDLGARDSLIVSDVTAAAAAADALSPFRASCGRGMGSASLADQVANTPRASSGSGSRAELEDGDAAMLAHMALVVGEACSLVETEVPENASLSSRAALSALRQHLKSTCLSLGHTAAILERG